jgi:uncharacterized repeat protein (TIGR03803 family)
MLKLKRWKIGCAVFLLCTTTAVVSPAQGFTNLFSFDGTDGEAPVGILAQGIDGNFYGATGAGGTDKGGGDGGTAFRVTPTGTLTTLYNFCSRPNCTDGDEPFWGVVLGTDGDLHGTNSFGGANNIGGTVYKMTSSGKMTVLYSFCSQSGCTDGDTPEGGVIEGIDGNYYGTTRNGGGNGAYCTSGACGVVFKTTPSGSTTTVYNFCNQPDCTDGWLPTAPLVQGADGNLYGSTNSLNGIPATIFKLTPTGTLTTLYSFPVNSNGVSALIQGTDGNFYGTITSGGDYTLGMAFKITPSGTLTPLYSFCANFGCTDGSSPTGLVQGTDGNFYGTTREGGENANGTAGGVIFSLLSTGDYNVLYNFCSLSNCADGSNPDAPPIQGTNGNFYGGTGGGGSLSKGTIYSMATGLGPFVKFLPGGGKVGAEVGILGDSLTGATAVTFNGIAAKFSVISSTLILTHVPTGAKSGLIEVTLPNGALSSNALFQVIP